MMESLNNCLNKNSFSLAFQRRAIIRTPKDSLIRNLKRMVFAESVFSLFFELRLIINLLISFIIIYYYYIFFFFFFFWRIKHENKA